MTHEEMVNSFLIDNSVIKCEDEDRTSNSKSRVSNLYGESSLKGRYDRNVKKGVCVECKDEFSIRTKKRYREGMVNGVDKSETTCARCRTKEVTESQAFSSKVKAKNKILASFNYDENIMSIYTSVTKMLRVKTSTLNKEELDSLIMNLKILQKVESAPNYKIRLEVAIEARNEMKKDEVDWDDWDTPLHSFVYETKGTK